ncbi:hypothetical protein CSB20_05380, partial [bacterium DOLZORAL124_64_63]
MNLHSPRFRRALLLLGVLTMLGGCLDKGDGDTTDSSAADTTATTGDKQDQKPKKPKKEKAIRVNVGAVARGNLVLPVFADGAIRTPRSLEVRTKVGGQLTQVLVRDGDKVRRNQLLARIDPREYEIALEENRYRHLQAL